MENRKKTILHLIQSLDNGGCENMLLRTLPLIENFEHTIITLRKEGELSKKFKEKGFKIINLNQKSIVNLGSYLRLIKEIKNIKPDVVVTYLFHADIIGRIVVQFFTKYRTVPFLRTTYNHPKYRAARWTEKLTKHFVGNYLANSESVKNFYVKNIGVKEDKITVIPNGIDLEFYDNVSRDENLRESFGIKKEKIAIICVANLHINKGHKYLLEAFEEIYENNRNIKLLIVGNGKEKENLLKQIENYNSKNSIIFLGERTNVPQLLKISDIFVLPTLFEGMSNAIMEAMASQLPIITTDIPENRELISNGQDGFLVTCKNPKALKEAIEGIIFEDVGKNLGKMARIELGRKFDIKKTIMSWNNFLAKIQK